MGLISGFLASKQYLPFCWALIIFLMLVWALYIHYLWLVKQPWKETFPLSIVWLQSLFFPPGHFLDFTLHVSITHTQATLVGANGKELEDPKMVSNIVFYLSYKWTNHSWRLLSISWSLYFCEGILLQEQISPQPNSQELFPGIQHLFCCKCNFLGWVPKIKPC